ncbi:S-layer homology domain-containing protein [Aminipila butyrica]|uniref:S-layer homology domain-containing protein n=1 Tax=Aminipila butyrica TaxID=433296 RepID=A0A858BWJ9_9FIRM|nr:S-layer homology domain-containing protein [Aminipila butyrica]QIB69104.1 S-layer homology domain-containing protein [Aminipila butyrica]
MTRKVFALLMAVMMTCCYMPAMAFAETNEMATKAPDTKFVDMPSDWSAAAIENAVANGLIKGYEGADGLYIKPNGTLTRAEMATVVNRAFGAQEKASLSGANDIVSGAWYEAEMAKAVQMGTMKKDGQMRPNANITRQEACTILARAFKMQSSDSTYAALNGFSDKNSVAAWAQDSMSVLAEKGYVSGANGALNPATNMTRAEFAKIMDNMVKQYITSAGTVETVAAAGNVMVNVPGVTLKNVTINGNLIIGDGVGSGDCTLDGVKVTGETIVRGGGVNSIIIKGGSSLGTVVVAKVTGNVRVAVEGDAKVSVIVVADGKDDVKIEGKVGTLKVEAETPVVIQKADVATVRLTAANATVTVDKDATVTNLKVEAAKAALNIKGTVSTVSVAKDATGAKITIAKEAKVNTLEANANVTTSGEGKPENTTGTGTVTTDNGKITPATPSTGGGGGGGGGSTPTPTPTPAKYSLTIGNEKTQVTTQITDLVTRSDAQLATGNYVNFTKALITFANSKDLPSQKAKLEAMLSESNTEKFAFETVDNVSLKNAYKKFAETKKIDELQALLLATAAVLDQPTSDKEKITTEYAELVAALEGKAFITSYNGKTGTLNKITVTTGSKSYNLYAKDGGAKEDGFVNAVYGKKLTEVIGNKAEIKVEVKVEEKTKTYTATIEKI